jgi:hypothetical protein
VGSEGEKFVGLPSFRVLLERLADGRPERSLIYSGLRGVRKTVLLLEFETLTRERGWICNDVEEVGSGDFRQTFAELAYQLLLYEPSRADAEARQQVPDTSESARIKGARDGSAFGCLYGEG